MKLWLGMGIALILFTGCNSNTKHITLQKRYAQQQLIIQQQQAQINALKEKLNTKVHRYVKRRSTTIPVIKKNIKLKKVEDNNFSSGYMYPQTRSKPKKPKPTVKLAQTSASPVASATPTTSSVMGKAECVAMIGQEKFDKYTQMFGSESASIKRCKMLKAMRN